MGISTAAKWDDLLEGAEVQLQRQGYSAPVIRDNKCIWKRLREYALEGADESYSPRLGQRFGSEVYLIDITQAPVTGNRRAARALRVLEDYYTTGIIHRRVYTRDVSFSPAYHDFCVAMMDSCKDMNLSTHTLRQMQRCVSDFTHEMACLGIVNINEIRHSHVVDFLGRQKDAARGTISKKAYLLRQFFMYACETGECSQAFLAKFPLLKHMQNTKVPSVFSREDIRRLLEQIDRKTPIGKRDYAILLLAAQLGIRAGDIRNLKHENLLWDAQRIEFRQSKTGRSISLPLLPETGWALIDYLKNGRPQSDSHHIFLRHLQPYEPFGPYNNLHSIITKYLRLAGIEASASSRQGLHALRHSLAGAMLGENIAMPVISEVLGHSNTQTTQVYLHISVPHLRSCALEVGI